MATCRNGRGCSPLVSALLEDPPSIPSLQFRDLRCISRHRRSLVAQRSRIRNQVQKVLDRSGVRIGAVLTDIFGANGRRVLDGLVGGLDRKVILASLSGHVRLKVDQLGDALRLELRETDRILLTDLLGEQDTLARRVSEFDWHIDQALAPFTEECRLLETISGIDRVSACGIPGQGQFRRSVDSRRGNGTRVRPGFRCPAAACG